MNKEAVRQPLGNEICVLSGAEYAACWNEKQEMACGLFCFRHNYAFTSCTY